MNECSLRPTQLLGNNNPALHLRRLLALSGSAVQHICHIVHVRNQASLHLVNRRQPQIPFESEEVSSADTTGANDPAQSLLSNLECRLPSKNSACRGQCNCIKAAVRFLVQFAVGQQGSATSQT